MLLSGGTGFIVTVLESQGDITPDAGRLFIGGTIFTVGTLVPTILQVLHAWPRL